MRWAWVARAKSNKKARRAKPRGLLRGVRRITSSLPSFRWTRSAPFSAAFVRGLLCPLVARLLGRLALCSLRDRCARFDFALHGGSFFDLDNDLRNHRGGDDGIEPAMHDRSHARRKLQIGDVDRLVERELREVDRDEFRQILGQTGNVELCQHVADDRTRKLHRGRILAVGEVQRHFHVDAPVRVDALEVDVQDFLLERVHLHVAQQHLLRRAVELHGEDRSVKGLVLERVDQGVVVELDRLRLAAAAIDDARRAAGAAQAPVGAAPMVARAARESREFLLHADSACAAPAGTCRRKR